MVARLEKAPVEEVVVRRIPPGASASPDDFAPGDFVLTHGRAWTSRCIRFGQRLRFRGADRKYTHWNHAALIVSEDGELVEALGAGVQQRNLRVYDGTEYHIVHVVASGEDRREAVAFARHSLGQRYGFVTVASIAIGLLTGAKFTFAFDGQAICSGLVARAQERTAAIFDRTPSHVTPADLASFYGVEPPPPGTPKGVSPPMREGVAG